MDRRTDACRDALTRLKMKKINLAVTYSYWLILFYWICTLYVISSDQGQGPSFSLWWASSLSNLFQWWWLNCVQNFDHLAADYELPDSLLKNEHK